MLLPGELWSCVLSCLAPGEARLQACANLRLVCRSLHALSPTLVSEVQLDSARWSRPTPNNLATDTLTPASTNSPTRDVIPPRLSQRFPLVRNVTIRLQSQPSQACNKRAHRASGPTGRNDDETQQTLWRPSPHILKELANFKHLRSLHLDPALFQPASSKPTLLAADVCSMLAAAPLLQHLTLPANLRFSHTFLLGDGQPMLPDHPSDGNSIPATPPQHPPMQPGKRTHQYLGLCSYGSSSAFLAVAQHLPHSLHSLSLTCCTIRSDDPGLWALSRLSALTSLHISSLQLTSRLPSSSSISIRSSGSGSGISQVSTTATASAMPQPPLVPSRTTSHTFASFSFGRHTMGGRSYMMGRTDSNVNLLQPIIPMSPTSRSSSSDLQMARSGSGSSSNPLRMATALMLCSPQSQGSTPASLHASPLAFLQHLSTLRRLRLGLALRERLADVAASLACLTNLTDIGLASHQALVAGAGGALAPLWGMVGLTRLELRGLGAAAGGAEAYGAEGAAVVMDEDPSQAASRGCLRLSHADLAAISHLCHLSVDGPCSWPEPSSLGPLMGPACGPATPTTSNSPAHAHAAAMMGGDVAPMLGLRGVTGCSSYSPQVPEAALAHLTYLQVGRLFSASDLPSLVHHCPRLRHLCIMDCRLPQQSHVPHFKSNAAAAAAFTAMDAAYVPTSFATAAIPAFPTAASACIPSTSAPAATSQQGPCSPGDALLPMPATPRACCPGQDSLRGITNPFSPFNPAATPPPTQAPYQAALGNGDDPSLAFCHLARLSDLTTLHLFVPRPAPPTQPLQAHAAANASGGGGVLPSSPALTATHPIPGLPLTPIKTQRPIHGSTIAPSTLQMNTMMQSPPAYPPMVAPQGSPITDRVLQAWSQGLPQLRELAISFTGSSSAAAAAAPATAASPAAAPATPPLADTATAAAARSARSSSSSSSSSNSVHRDAAPLHAQQAAPSLVLLRPSSAELMPPGSPGTRATPPAAPVPSDPTPMVQVPPVEGWAVPAIRTARPQPMLLAAAAAAAGTEALVHAQLQLPGPTASVAQGPSYTTSLTATDPATPTPAAPVPTGPAAHPLVTDAGLLHVAGGVPRLERLVLGGLPRVTAQPLAAVAMKPRLQRLLLLGCPGVRAEAALRAVQMVRGAEAGAGSAGLVMRVVDDL